MGEDVSSGCGFERLSGNGDNWKAGWLRDIQSGLK